MSGAAVAVAEGEGVGFTGVIGFVNLPEEGTVNCFVSKANATTEEATIEIKTRAKIKKNFFLIVSPPKKPDIILNSIMQTLNLITFNR